jgi:glycosyltransferase involved in cell wall biosynthesis
VLSIAEDGSTDGTPEVLDRLRAEIPTLQVWTNPLRMGRGWAIRRLWSQVSADAYVFADADLAAGPQAILGVARRVLEGADVVTGSRYCPGAQVHRPRLRDFSSRAYNEASRFLFHEQIRDHQCGLKGFSRRAVEKVLPSTRTDNWFWDTEVLVRALREGFPVVEVPIEWNERRGNRTPLGRLLSDIYLHGTGLARLSWELRRSYAGRPIGRYAPSPVVERAEPKVQG